MTSHAGWDKIRPFCPSKNNIADLLPRVDKSGYKAPQIMIYGTNTYIMAVKMEDGEDKNFKNKPSSSPTSHKQIATTYKGGMENQE